MFPSLAYTGTHERDTVDPDRTTIRFLDVLADAEFNREELSQLPAECGMVIRPFSAMASGVLLYNAPVRDMFMEG